MITNFEQLTVWIWISIRVKLRVITDAPGLKLTLGYRDQKHKYEAINQVTRQWLVSSTHQCQV